ncbi:HTH_38 domain-containing protein [Trichonephila clavipes]|nr:HTH_38 domain-containing protein [Trichonephila clavipes]
MDQRSSVEDGLSLPTSSDVTNQSPGLLSSRRYCFNTGLGSNPGEDMDVYKCIVPSRHWGTTISRRPASPLMWKGKRGGQPLTTLKIWVETSQIVLLPRKDSGLPRYCGLSFREIGSRVGRNQATVMRICDRWMQEGTTNRRGRSHPSQCTTSHEDRQIVRMAVTDHSVTSRTVAQHIESVMHHSVSACTICRRLPQSGLSARRPLLGLPLTQTTDVSATIGAMKEGCGRQNGVKLSLPTSHASVCNTTMVGFEFGDTVERGC